MTSLAELELRPITGEDREINLRVYSSTRQEELAQLPWSAEEKAAFLVMQFDAQDRHYRTHYPDACLDLVLDSGEPIGRLYVDRREEEIRVVDIALLPEHRGQGIGRRMMEAILAEGRIKDLLVRIHVEQHNPAMRLYRRLGFERINRHGIYDLMEWRPPATVGASRGDERVD